LGALAAALVAGLLQAAFMSPSIEHTYQLSAQGPAANAVTTTWLNTEGNYVTSYALNDGILRSRQNQAQVSTAFG
jgi:hypothetical protein